MLVFPPHSPPLQPLLPQQSRIARLDIFTLPRRFGIQPPLQYCPIYVINAFLYSHSCYALRSASETVCVREKEKERVCVYVCVSRYVRDHLQGVASCVPHATHFATPAQLKNHAYFTPRNQASERQVCTAHDNMPACCELGITERGCACATTRRVHAAYSAPFSVGK